MLCGMYNISVFSVLNCCIYLFIYVFQFSDCLGILCLFLSDFFTALFVSGFKHSKLFADSAHCSARSFNVYCYFRFTSTLLCIKG